MSRAAGFANPTSVLTARHHVCHRDVGLEPARYVPYEAELCALAEAIEQGVAARGTDGGLVHVDTISGQRRSAATAVGLVALDLAVAVAGECERRQGEHPGTTSHVEDAPCAAQLASRVIIPD